MEFDDGDLLNNSILCSLESVSTEKKLLYISVYFLVWGEAANVRFLPECLCYIFHHVSNPLFDNMKCHGGLCCWSMSNPIL